jgi:serine/threonine-protein kinase RsbW
MPGPPAPFVRRFRDLDRVVDEVHAVFDGWVESAAYAEVLDEDRMHVMRLAVHEWIANLVQHAAFGGRRPEITLTVWPEPGGLRCLIEDNSDGFDFLGQVAAKAAAQERVEPPPERGRGLLIVTGCTQDLAYEGAAAGRHRLGFVIRSAVEPEALDALFPTEGEDGFADGDEYAGPGLAADALPDGASDGSEPAP